MTDEERTEVELKTGMGSVAYKGKQIAEIIAIACLALLFLLTYVLWEHKEDAKSMRDAFSSGFKEMTSAMREQNRISREQVCLLSLSPEKREREFMSDGSFCKRLASER